MAATCGANFAKIVLIVFNVIFLMAGIVLIAVGIWIIADPNIIEPIKLLKGAFGANFLRNASILLITMGVVVILVTVLGLFAAIKENTIAMGIYIGFLILVCCGEIAGGVVAIVFKDKAIEQVAVSIYSTFEELNRTTDSKYYSINSYNSCYTKDMSALVDYVQTRFQCCGIVGSVDYDLFFEFNTSYTCRLNGSASFSENVPLSCCLPRSNENTNNVYSDINALSNAVNCTSSNYYKDGCAVKLIVFVEKYAPVIIGIGLGFGFLELFGIIFAVCLCQNPEKDF